MIVGEEGLKHANQLAKVKTMLKADFPFELGGLIQAVVFLLISSKLIAAKADKLFSRTRCMALLSEL